MYSETSNPVLCYSYCLQQDFFKYLLARQLKACFILVFNMMIAVCLKVPFHKIKIKIEFEIEIECSLEHQLALDKFNKQAVTLRSLTKQV